MAAGTYTIAATRAGQSVIVNETTTKTYVVALPAVLTEGSTSGGGGVTTTARVMVMA
jgi:hypothetical protein